MAYTINVHPDSLAFKPNDIPQFELDQVRTITVDMTAAAGSNTISGTPTATCDSLTIGSVTVGSKTASFNVTGDQVGIYQIIFTAVLSSGETIKGPIRAKVVDNSGDSVRDYE